MKCSAVILLASLAILLAACAPGQPAATIPSPHPTAREDLPVFPGAEQASSEEDSLYYYRIRNVDIRDVQGFYKKEMQNAGWQFLGSGDLSGEDTGQSYGLWFAKGGVVATIEVNEQYRIVYVLFQLE